MVIACRHSEGLADPSFDEVWLEKTINRVLRGMPVVVTTRDLPTTDCEDWAEAVIARVQGTGKVPSAIYCRFQDLPNVLRKDLRALWHIVFCPRMLSEHWPSASTSLRHDREVMMQVVRTDAKTLQFTSKTLQGTKEVVLSANFRGIHPSIFECVDVKLMNDRELVLHLVKQNGAALQYASLSLQCDKELILEAAKNHRWAVCVDGQEIPADRDVALLVVKAVPWAVGILAGDQRRDREIALEAVKHGAELGRVSEQFRNDKEIVLEAVKLGGAVLRNASEDLQDDKEVVLEAMKTDYDAVQYVSHRLQEDREVVLASVQRDGSALFFARETFRCDPEIVSEACKTHSQAWEVADEVLRMDKDFALDVARSIDRTVPGLGWINPNYVTFLGMQEALMPREQFENAVSSPIALRGENAPVVSVTLDLVPVVAAQKHEDKSNEAENTPGQDQHNEGEHEEEAEGAMCFRAAVSLLSGVSFVCHLQKGRKDDRERSPFLTLNELAAKIVADLPNHTEITNVERVFINFILTDDGDCVAVTPWDVDNALEEYLHSDEC